MQWHTDPTWKFELVQNEQDAAGKLTQTCAYKHIEISAWSHGSLAQLCALLH